MTTSPPRWDLSNVYSGLDSPDLIRDIDRVKTVTADLEKYYREKLDPIDPTAEPELINRAISTTVDKINQITEKAATIQYFLYSFVTTDSYNQQAQKMESQFDQIMVRIQQVETLLKAWIGRFRSVLPEVLALGGSAGGHAFPIREIAEQSQYLMSEKEEFLSSELSLSGAIIWSKLQGNVTSQKTVEFELDGEMQTMPMPALINLYTHPEESVRRHVYDAEFKAWDSVKVPLAACINGIKGWSNTLIEHRGRQDALHEPIDRARIDRETLEVMLAAMRESFPDFRRYFKAKAARFSQDSLPWWNLFAPTGKLEKKYTFAEAAEFIIDNFGKFSPDLKSFAQTAFDNNWIDAEQRAGKRGGAFCMPVPGVKESRILCNFDGSFDQVITIAHELGHGYHNFNMYRQNKTPLQQKLPMTMAETASIMCETIIFNAMMVKIDDPQAELGLLESALIGDSQVIVDIYSRYLFEKEFFARREKAELSADELCEIMEEAQAATYGDGLNPDYRHMFMWTWKPHYYFTEENFYNFPYAFGLLFGVGLYAVYQQRGEDFIPDYQNLLASTGEAPAADLAARFDIDIRSKQFWADSLAVVAKRIDRYCEL